MPLPPDPLAKNTDLPFFLDDGYQQPKRPPITLNLPKLKNFDRVNQIDSLNVQSASPKKSNESLPAGNVGISEPGEMSKADAVKAQNGDHS